VETIRRVIKMSQDPGETKKPSFLSKIDTRITLLIAGSIALMVYAISATDKEVQNYIDKKIEETVAKRYDTNAIRSRIDLIIRNEHGEPVDISDCLSENKGAMQGSMHIDSDSSITYLVTIKYQPAGSK